MDKDAMPEYPAIIVDVLEAGSQKYEWPLVEKSAYDALRAAAESLVAENARLREERGTLAGYTEPGGEWKWTPLGEHIVRLERERDEQKLVAEQASARAGAYAEELFGSFLRREHDGDYTCVHCEAAIDIAKWTTAKHADGCIINKAAIDSALAAKEP